MFRCSDNGKSRIMNYRRTSAHPHTHHLTSATLLRSRRGMLRQPTNLMTRIHTRESSESLDPTPLPSLAYFYLTNDWYLSRQIQGLGFRGPCVQLGSDAQKLPSLHQPHLTIHVQQRIIHISLPRRVLCRSQVLVMRLSGLQKEVLDLYRQCIRESRKKTQVCVPMLPSRVSS